ncbi:MAG TPA: hypothetical protein VHF05_00455 [Candidatus Paceibacterota bacterium]|nr:hypothetical protein [Candidatus Paceibacterota bacterium]
MKVLIFNDEQKKLDEVKGVLDHVLKGYSVEITFAHVGNSFEANRACGRGEFDIIFADHFLDKLEPSNNAFRIVLRAQHYGARVFTTTEDTDVASKEYLPKGIPHVPLVGHLIAEKILELLDARQFK